jgi:hypothetical protein
MRDRSLDLEDRSFDSEAMFLDLINLAHSQHNYGTPLSVGIKRHQECRCKTRGRNENMGVNMAHLG